MLKHKKSLPTAENQKSLPGELERRKRLSVELKRRRRASFWFLSPSIAGVTLFFLAPFTVVLYYAFTSKSVSGEFVGLANFKALFENSAFSRAAVNTIILLVTAVPLAVLLSLGLALLLEKEIYMFKNKMRRLSFLISVIMLTSVFLSMLTVTVSAQTPDLENNNPNTHTACFTYKIRQTAIDGTVRETVSKRANRNSTVYSNNYSYSVSNWMQIYTSGSINGYCRCDMVCPANRCFEVNASNGLRIRSAPSTTASVVCTVEDETFLQIISVVNGSNMSYVRVRTGSYEGVIGYVADNTYITEVNSNYAHG